MNKAKVKYVLLRAISAGPTLLSTFCHKYSTGADKLTLPELYEIVWELEKESELVCLDFYDGTHGNTICFNAETTVIQPGIRVLFPKEQEFVNAMQAKGIMSENDLSLLTGDNRIMFVRTMMAAFVEKSPSDIKFEYNRWLIKFMNYEEPKEE